MPGAPFLYVSDSYQGVSGEGVPAGAGGMSSGIGWGFWVWLVIIGVIIPIAVLGGLKAGGFQFVYRRR
jgi:hypothetical protein